jgi:hypothetical protein
MFRAASWCSVTLAVCALSLCEAQKEPVPEKAKPKPVGEKAPPRQAEIDWPATLNKSVSLQQGINPMPLQEAVENLENLVGITILIDSQAFRTDLSDDDVAGKQVKLPKMMGVHLRTVLRFLVEQINGDYLVLDDHVEITTPSRARPEAWQGIARSIGHPMLPLVYARFEDTGLRDALKELGAIADVSVVLDGRVAGNYGNQTVTACLKNVPADSAARTIAECVGLKAVQLDNVLFITDFKAAAILEKENANRIAKLRKEKETQPTPGAA